MKNKLLLLVALSLPIVLGGCRGEQELPFETIEQVNIPGSIKQWKGKEPRLLIVSSGEDIKKAEQFVTDEAMTALSRLDFTTHFAVIAFRGLQSNSHKGFHVERIARRGNEVAFHAQAGRLGGDNVLSSPYHVIKVRKEGKWRGVFTFKLYFGEDEQAVATATHRIP